MKLADYLAKTKIKRTAFAERVGVSQSLITQLCLGQVWPGRDVASRIMAATEGEVTPNDFLPAEQSDEAAA